MPKSVTTNRAPVCSLPASMPAIVPPSSMQSVAFQIELSMLPSEPGTNDNTKPRMRQITSATMLKATIRANVPLTSRL